MVDIDFTDVDLEPFEWPILSLLFNDTNMNNEPSQAKRKEDEPASRARISLPSRTGDGTTRCVWDSLFSVSVSLIEEKAPLFTIM